MRMITTVVTVMTMAMGLACVTAQLPECGLSEGRFRGIKSGIFEAIRMDKHPRKYDFNGDGGVGLDDLVLVKEATQACS